MYPVSILYKCIAGRYRTVRVADGPITARYRFIKNASWVFFVKVCLESRYGIDVADCIDNISLEFCKCTNRANLPVFANFLLSISPMSLHNESDSNFHTIWSEYITAKY